MALLRCSALPELFSQSASVLKTLPLSVLPVKGKAKGTCVRGGRDLHQNCSPVSFHQKKIRTVLTGSLTSPWLWRTCFSPGLLASHAVEVRRSV